MNSPQQKRDVLYLKRTPTVTYDSTSGAPIPESIKKFYVQQQLPVRKQSLAANHNHNKLDYRKRIQQQSLPRQHIKLSHNTIVEDLSVINKNNLLFIQQEDDEFIFKGRPPSSVISIQPIDVNDDDDEDDDEEEEAIIEWETSTTTANMTPLLSGQSISLLELPIDNNEKQDLRLSIDTVLTDCSELTITQQQPLLSDSVLLKINEKRQEQLKSIHAYRQQQQNLNIALLSEIANEFYKKITIATTMSKDGIEHHDVFTGKEAVDCILSILQLTDRSVAIDVGCALRHQNFFHDVNYDEPLLIDSIDELYAYKDMMNTQKEDHDNNGLSVLDLPNGVYTDLTDCYSTTCTLEDPCYSWSCPKRKNLKRAQRQSAIQTNKEKSRLWLQTVPEAIVLATSPEERKRQECIYELIYTEQDFVRDLQYCQDFWIEPLLNNDVIPENDRQTFVNDVFYNIQDIKKVNSELSKALSARQSERYLVSSIGDIILEHIRYFQTFIEYGSHQIIGKFTFELEKKRNPVFAAFVEETERLPESRRLELNGYLTKPTTRLGRYNLLLKEILKRTPDDNPDKINIPIAMDKITHYLQQVNIEAGKCENKFNLKQISERLEFRSPADYVDLQLDKPGRQLLMKGRMKRKGNSSEASDLQVFLFDHYLVVAKIKYEDHLEKYRTHKRPIPLQLLSITTGSTHRHKRASSILPYSKSISSNAVAPKPSTSESTPKPHSLAIHFTHHGRKGSPPFTLFTSATSIQQLWVKKITDQKELLAEQQRVFTVLPLVRQYFPIVNKVNHTVIDNESRILLGTDHGVYMSDGTTTTKIIALEKVSQVEVMSESQLLVLSDKTLWAYPLVDVFSTQQVKRGKVVYQNASFIHIGECMSKKLVCVVKSNTLSGTTIRVLERVMMDENKKTKSMFSLKRLVVRGGHTGLKAYKDLYSPSEVTAISLLKTQMCITSPKEIGVVDMKSFGVQALLDPEDEGLDFVFQRPDVIPIAIYRIEFAKFLVCYNEFAFCVDQRGRFIKSSARIDWEGAPDSFALSYPYVLAFEPDFIEIRNIETGELGQIIRGKNIRCTNSDTHTATIHCAMDDPENEGYQLVFQLEKNK